MPMFEHPYSTPRPAAKRIKTMGKAVTAISNDTVLNCESSLETNVVNITPVDATNTSVTASLSPCNAADDEPITSRYNDWNNSVLPTIFHFRNSSSSSGLASSMRTPISESIPARASTLEANLRKDMLSWTTILNTKIEEVDTKLDLLDKKMDRLLAAVLGNSTAKTISSSKEPFGRGPQLCEGKHKLCNHLYFRHLNSLSSLLVYINLLSVGILAHRTPEKLRMESAGFGFPLKNKEELEDLSFRITLVDSMERTEDANVMLKRQIILDNRQRVVYSTL